MSVFVEVCNDRGNAEAREAEIRAAIPGAWESKITEDHLEVLSHYVPDANVPATRGPRIYTGSEGGLNGPACVLLMWK